MGHPFLTLQDFNSFVCNLHHEILNNYLRKNMKKEKKYTDEWMNIREIKLYTKLSESTIRRYYVCPFGTNRLYKILASKIPSKFIKLA